MLQNDQGAVLKQGSDLLVPAILAGTLLLGGFTAFSAVVLGYELIALFRH